MAQRSDRFRPRPAAAGAGIGPRSRLGASGLLRYGPAVPVVAESGDGLSPRLAATGAGIGPCPRPGAGRLPCHGPAVPDVAKSGDGLMEYRKTAAASPHPVPVGCAGGICFVVQYPEAVAALRTGIVLPSQRLGLQGQQRRKKQKRQHQTEKLFSPSFHRVSSLSLSGSVPGRKDPPCLLRSV